MTVKQLIAHLAEYPPDAVVLATAADHRYRELTVYATVGRQMPPGSRYEWEEDPGGVTEFPEAEYGAVRRIVVIE